MRTIRFLVFIGIFHLLASCSFSSSTNPPTPVPSPPPATTPVPSPTPTPNPVPVPTPNPEPVPMPPPPMVSGATYLSLGDSYTIGQSVPESGRWSVQLVEQLRNEGMTMELPDIIARTGWTTAELAMAIKASANTKKYPMVSLLIGVNNQYRGQSTDRYRTEFADLLVTAIDFADGKPAHVFVLSIPDWGVTPYANGMDRQKIAREIDAFNLVAAQECRNAGVAFIDITQISRQAANDPSMVADDLLHFSGKMYRKFAEAAFPTAKKILEK